MGRWRILSVRSQVAIRRAWSLWACLCWDTEVFRFISSLPEGCFAVQDVSVTASSPKLCSYVANWPWRLAFRSFQLQLWNLNKHVLVGVRGHLLKVKPFSNSPSCAAERLLGPLVVCTMLQFFENLFRMTVVLLCVSWSGVCPHLQRLASSFFFLDEV